MVAAQAEPDEGRVQRGAARRVARPVARVREGHLLAGAPFEPDAQVALVTVRVPVSPDVATLVEEGHGEAAVANEDRAERDPVPACVLDTLRGGPKSLRL